MALGRRENAPPEWTKFTIISKAKYQNEPISVLSSAFDFKLSGKPINGIGEIRDVCPLIFGARVPLQI